VARPIISALTACWLAHEISHSHWLHPEFVPVPVFLLSRWPIRHCASTQPCASLGSLASSGPLPGWRLQPVWASCLLRRADCKPRSRKWVGFVATAKKNTSKMTAHGQRHKQTQSAIGITGRLDASPDDNSTYPHHAKPTPALNKDIFTAPPSAHLSACPPHSALLSNMGLPSWPSSLLAALREPALSCCP